MNYLDKLPDELLYYIYTMDPTYKLKYNQCISELSNKIKNHKIINTTYRCVINSDKKYFKNFSPIFSKYFFIKLNA